MGKKYMIGKDDGTLAVSVDDVDDSRKIPRKDLEIVDWLTKDWINQRSKPFNPKIRKIYK